MNWGRGREDSWSLVSLPYKWAGKGGPQKTSGQANPGGERREWGTAQCVLPPLQVAMKHPSAVTACNLDLENLVTDSNRSIATLAITTLLKTGSESSIDRLMKQISSFMSEISDEFKVPRGLTACVPREMFSTCCPCLRLGAHSPASRSLTLCPFGPLRIGLFRPGRGLLIHSALFIELLLSVLEFHKRTAVGGREKL